MKNLIVSFAIIATLAMMLFTSCTITVRNTENSELTGETVKKRHDVGQFTGIKTQGGCEVIFVEDDSCYIEIEADKAIQADIETELKDSILNLSFQKISFKGEVISDDSFDKKNNTVTIHGIKNAIKHGFTNNIKVHVHAPQLNYIHTSGSIELKSKAMKSDSLCYIHTAGASKIEIDHLEAQVVDIHTAGASDIKANVHDARFTAISTAGASDLKFHLTNCDQVILKTNGACSAKFSGKVKSFTKQCNGAGDVDTDELKIE